MFQQHTKKEICRLGQGEDSTNEATLPAYNHKNTHRRVKSKAQNEKKKLGKEKQQSSHSPQRSAQI